MTFDEIRAQNPELGFCVYALEPGGVVTLEVIAPDDEIFSFAGPTLEAVLAQAFPEAGIPATTNQADDTASIFD